MNSETLGTAWQRLFHPSRGKPRGGKHTSPPANTAVEPHTNDSPAPASWTSDFDLPSIRHHRDSVQ